MLLSSTQSENSFAHGHLDLSKSHPKVLATFRVIAYESLQNLGLATVLQGVTKLNTVRKFICTWSFGPIKISSQGPGNI